MVPAPIELSFGNRPGDQASPTPAPERRYPSRRPGTSRSLRPTPTWGHENAPGSMTGDIRALLEVQYRSRGLESFKPRCTVPLASDRLWVVYRGAIALETCLADGSEVIVGLAGPGTLFGSALTALDPYRAVVLSEATLLPLSLAQVSQSPVLARSLLRYGLNRLEQAIELKALLTLNSAEERLRRLLSLLGRTFGQVTPLGLRLDIRLTHQTLGAMAGTSRVTVTRLLQELRAKGQIDWHSDRHLILTPSLRQAA